MSHDEQKWEIARELFGSVQSPNRDTRRIVRKSEFQAPLELGGTIRVLCNSCGELFEITDEGREGLAKKAGSATPPRGLSHFYEVTGCELCDDSYHKVQIKRVKDREIET